MKRQDEYQDYQLAAQLTPLRFIEPDRTIMQSITITFPAWGALKAIEREKYAGFELCINQLQGLLTALKTIMPDRKSDGGSPETVETNYNEPINAWQKTQIIEALNALETALSIQFGQVNTYRVTAKGTHDPRKLIESPEETFGVYWNGISEMAKADWRAGARCLAFELPTACGFHVIRSMEAAVIDCLTKLGKAVERNEKRDLGRYIELLKACEVPEEATDIVEQIRKHHRNPLMHPEDVLDLPMAMSLFDLCRAAIIALVSHLANKMLVSLEPGQLPLITLNGAK